jgi:hypothetical protein
MAFNSALVQKWKKQCMLKLCCNNENSQQAQRLVPKQDT